MIRVISHLLALSIMLGAFQNCSRFQASGDGTIISVQSPSLPLPSPVPSPVLAAIPCAVPNGSGTQSSAISRCLVSTCEMGFSIAANGTGCEMAPSSTFTFVSRTVATCPGDPTNKNWCATYWPPTSDGTVYLYSITETRTALGQMGTTIPRTAYVYIPTRLASASPVLIHFHGGTNNAASMFSKFKFAQIADGRSFTWQQNTSTCQFSENGFCQASTGQSDCATYVSNGSTCNANGPTDCGFETSAGVACTAATPTISNSQPFVVVYPNGVADPNSQYSNIQNNLAANVPRHWEDGQVPSPGWNTTEQNRDDVTFTNFLISELKILESSSVDVTRIYVSGDSNGGAMTQRIACNSGNTNEPELQNVAAYSSSISNMVLPMSMGSDGRETCGAAVQNQPIALAMFVGQSVPTPQCPPNASCLASVSGDERNAYGVTGQIYWTNESLPGGQEVNSPDTQTFWVAAIAAASGQATAQSSALGFFTEKTITTFSNSQSRYQLFVTQWGRHETLSTRQDFNPDGQIWAFVSSFQRASNGSLSYTNPTWLQGPY